MREADVAEKLQNIFTSQNKSKNLNDLNDEELDELIASNPEI